MRRMSGWVTMASPVSAPPATTLKIPGGRRSSLSAATASGRERGLHGGLEDQRVAGHQRRRHLHAREERRVVVRADRADDSPRCGLGEVQARRRRDRASVQLGADTGDQLEVGGALVRTRLHRLERRPTVAGVEAAELLRLGPDAAGELLEARSPLDHRQAGPCRLGGLGGLDGAVDVGPRRHVHLGQQLTRRG